VAVTTLTHRHSPKIQLLLSSSSHHVFHSPSSTLHSTFRFCCRSCSYPTQVPWTKIKRLQHYKPLPCCGTTPKGEIFQLSQVTNNQTTKFGKLSFNRPGTSSSGPTHTPKALTFALQNSDSSYFAPISIGTPWALFLLFFVIHSHVGNDRGQHLDVILDTGSADLWVATSQCETCSSGTTTFDESKSSSFKAPSSPSSVQIHYGSGAVSGDIATDTVTMGTFTINQQTIGKSLSLSISSSF
jgi:hypothetical protein